MSRSKLYKEYDNNGNLIKKECSKCHEIKEVNCYYKRKDNKDGIYSQCKKCMSEIQNKYYLNNKEKISKIQADYQRNNKEKINEYHRKYRKNNQEKVNERERQYRKNNIDKFREYRHQYRERNRDKLNELSRQYRENNKEKERKRLCEYRENNRDKIHESARKYRENNKEKIRQHYIDNKEKISKNHREYYKNNREKILEYVHQYSQQQYKDKINQEINRIYENVTKKLYPNNDIQYGIIYGVHCKVTNRWYIGQTTTSFNIRYKGDFLNSKSSELSEDSIKGKLLSDDIEKYGKETFELFEVLDVAFSERELDEKEVYYIDYYKAYDEGYNSNRGNIFKHNKSKRKEVI